MFTSDNFNKYPQATELLEEMIREKIRLPFFVQCDTQVARDERFFELLARAGCFQMFVGVESFSRKTLLSAHKTQNYPEQYGVIVRHARKYGILSHFSNIIGFPEDTHSTVREHLDYLRALKPDIASFYILTPIPGTQQSDEFMDAGWITETNLDRFDATTPTWRHPEFSPAELHELLYRCYTEFYSRGHVLQNILTSLRPKNISPGLLPYLGVPVFMRYSAFRKEHPMSGGIRRVKIDGVGDYLHLRRKVFDAEQVPLPRSLNLSKADAELNARVKMV
jgi:radical SAM superfamily enzyme YgiQ (UPF0313 family)